MIKSFCVSTCKYSKLYSAPKFQSQMDISPSRDVHPSTSQNFCFYPSCVVGHALQCELGSGVLINNLCSSYNMELISNNILLCIYKEEGCVVVCVH